jgi:hypothetical protein
VGVYANHEEEGKMMGVPECFEALLTDFVLSGGIHQEHDEEHEMTGDAASLCVMNIDSTLLANF